MLKYIRHYLNSRKPLRTKNLKVDVESR